MNLHWRLRTRLGEEILVLPGWAQGEGRASEAFWGSAISFDSLDWLLGTFGLDQRVVLELYRDIGGHADTSPWQPDVLGPEVILVLKEAFRSGKLVAFKVQPARSLQAFSWSTPIRAPTSAEETKEAFELSLFDSTTGLPLVDVPLSVRTSAGDERKVKTDSAGSVRIPALPLGHCEVTSVIVGARIETSFSYKSGVGAAAERAQTEEPDADAAPVHLVRAAAHRVSTGETPQSIARRWNVPWSEIARFNWGTDDATALEERYAEELGCRRRTEDGRHFQFDDEDDPGIIVIPFPWRMQLEVGRIHRLSAEPMRPLFVSLENEHGLRLPGAAFRLRTGDGQERSGRLGRSGIARLTGIQEGAFVVSYPDDEDILARSLAASVRRAFDEQATAPLFHLLGQSVDVVRRAQAI